MSLLPPFPPSSFAEPPLLDLRTPSDDGYIVPINKELYLRFSGQVFAEKTGRFVINFSDATGKIMDACYSLRPFRGSFPGSDDLFREGPDKLHYVIETDQFDTVVLFDKKDGEVEVVGQVELPNIPRTKQALRFITLSAGPFPMLVILDDLPNKSTQGNHFAMRHEHHVWFPRFFQQFAHESLYEIVDLDDTMAILLFDLVLTYNPEYAIWLKDLKINLEYRTWSYDFPGDTRLAQASQAQFPQHQMLHAPLFILRRRRARSGCYIPIYAPRGACSLQPVVTPGNRGTKAAFAMSRLTNCTNGMPQKFIRRLSLVLSHQEWNTHLLSGTTPFETELCRKGSVGFAMKPSKPQRLACRFAVGGLRSTAAEALNLHANLLPVHLRLNLAVFKIVQHCKKIPCSHRSPIHHLFDAFPVLRRANIEISDDTPIPDVEDTISFHIAVNKAEAEIQTRETCGQMKCIFTDGSGYQARVGAAAWSSSQTAPNGEVSRRLYIGRDIHYTVFQAEIIGAILGLDIILSTPRLTKAAILIDSQAAIKAIRNRSPGNILVREFYRKLRRLKKARKTLQVKVVWVPGHMGVEGNERADEEAKKAALGDSTELFDKEAKSILAKGLPVSRAAMVEQMTKEIKRQRQDEWSSSTKCRFLKNIDSIPSHNRLERNLQRPFPSYRSERSLLSARTVLSLKQSHITSYYAALRHNMKIRHLLSDRSKHVKQLMAFVKATNRFPVVFNGSPPEEASQGDPQD
ncbi:hypothetical protein C8J56DRAFT_1045686 [Mycena floridula]|nr:hypothetical protein C8J56DRAFT_1045686 [Mycena floridula]